MFRVHFLIRIPCFSAGIDLGAGVDDPSSLPQPSVNQSSRPLSEEQLDGILSPELDKMVTDGKIFALHLGFLKDMSKYDFQRFLHAYLQFNFSSDNFMSNAVLYQYIEMMVVNISTSLFYPRSNSWEVI